MLNLSKCFRLRSPVCRGMHNPLSRTMFIGTETTPNPSSMKFLPQREVLPEKLGTGMFFQQKDKSEIERSPLAKALFAIDGVKSVFLGKEFITITKASSTRAHDWTQLNPEIFSAILDFYAKGEPVFVEKQKSKDTAVLPDDSEIVTMIKELIESKIRPNVQDDGGDIFYESFDEETGIVKVSLAGSCVGCPSSKVTLKQGVENMLMHYIEEVNGVEEVIRESHDGGANVDDSPLVLRPQHHEGNHEHSDSCKH